MPRSLRTTSFPGPRQNSRRRATEAQRRAAQGIRASLLPIAGTVGGALIGQGRAAGRGIAIFHPLLKLLGRAGADISTEIRLDAAQAAKVDKLMRAELVGFGDFLPAAEAPRPFV